MGGHQHIDGILDVVRRDLCHRCGACVGVCPSGALKLDADGVPRRAAACTECGLCVKVCSGAGVDFPDLGERLYGDGYRFGSLLGEFKTTCLGGAMDDEVRWRGASGGIATQLLIHLLESRRIDGALVAIGDPADPCLGKGIIARSRDEILTAAQSRYTTTPSLAALREVVSGEGSYAVVGLPCQVHAIRKAEQAGMAWTARIKLLIGLFCCRSLPARASRELAALVTPRGRKVAEIRYRQSDGRGWPHNTMEIWFTDGSAWRSPYLPNDTVSLLSWLYRVPRCRACPDIGAEFADIALADPWIRDGAGRWKCEEPGGLTSIIVRTARGQAALDEAVHAGAIRVRPLAAREITDGQALAFRSKKRVVPLRLAVGRLLRRPMPAYGIALPRPTVGAILRELKSVPVRLASAVSPLRRFVLRLGFSRLGGLVMKLRGEQKRRLAIKRILAVLLSAGMSLASAGGEMPWECAEEDVERCACLDEAEIPGLLHRRLIT